MALPYSIREFADPYKQELTIIEFRDLGLNFEGRAFVSVFKLSDGRQFSSQVDAFALRREREPMMARLEIDMRRLREVGVSRENIISFFENLGRSRPEPPVKRTVVMMDPPSLSLLEGLDLIAKRETAKKKKPENPAKEFRRSIEI